jgi:hypothetical protein
MTMDGSGLTRPCSALGCSPTTICRAARGIVHSPHPVTEAAWRVGLEDLSPEDLTDAAKAVMRLADRLPTVAALRQAAGEIARDRRRSTPKLEAPMGPIPEDYAGDWQTVSQTLAKRREGGSQ